MRKTLSICFDQIKKYLSKKHCKLLSQFLEENKEEEEIAGRQFFHGFYNFSKMIC